MGGGRGGGRGGGQGGGAEEEKRVDVTEEGKQLVRICSSQKNYNGQLCHNHGVEPV